MIVFKKLSDDAVTPARATDGSAGFDLSALDPEIIESMNWKLIKTGISVDVGRGRVGYVCSRSGLALKHGLFVLNAPGIIDEDYRGDVGVILANFGPNTAYIKRGDRIAQLLVTGYVGESVEVDSLDETARASGGFGSTGGFTVNELPYYSDADDPC